MTSCKIPYNFIKLYNRHAVEKKLSFKFGQDKISQNGIDNIVCCNKCVEKYYKWRYPNK